MTLLARKRTTVLVFALTLTVGAVLGYAQTHSNRQPVEFGTLRGAQGTKSASPRVLSGADIGFRVDSTNGDTVVGHFVVRVGNQWREVETPVGPKLLTHGR